MASAVGPAQHRCEGEDTHPVGCSQPQSRCPAPAPAWPGSPAPPLFPGFTYSTSSPRRARKAPSSMQLIWFLSSCL